MNQQPPSTPKTQPGATPRTEAVQQARRDREAAALRENLRRRKAQARARLAPDKPGSPAKPPA